MILALLILLAYAMGYFTCYCITVTMARKAAIQQTLQSGESMVLSAEGLAQTVTEYSATVQRVIDLEAARYEVD